MKLAPLAAAFTLSGIMAGSALALLPRAEVALAAPPAVLVGGWVPPERSELRAWLQGRGERLGEREAYLELPEAVEIATFEELGLRLDVERTLEAVAQTRVEPTWFERLRRWVEPRPDLPDVPLEFTFDPDRARARLERLRPVVHREPENARLDLKGKRNVPDVPGRMLDLPGSVAAVARGERDENAVFRIATIPVQAAVTAEMLSALDVSKVLASYETDFSRKRGPRIRNIRKAAEYLNGVVIGPGEVLSFNRTVGARTEARGFVEAPVIVADEMEPGLGGGVCQVASTLHAAAVFGALEVVERRSHSRPSGYTPLGLDATVIWGEVDLKIENPYDTPIIVHAYLPTPLTVRVELLGREPPGVVKHDYWVRESEDFFRRVVYKPELPAGEYKRHQKGIKGYDIRSTVKLVRPDGSVSTHGYASRYWPVPEIYWVSPGSDAAVLPELPAGATHVEVGGEEASPAPSDFRDAALTESERWELSR